MRDGSMLATANDAVAQSDEIDPLPRCGLGQQAMVRKAWNGIHFEHPRLIGMVQPKINACQSAGPQCGTGILRDEFKDIPESALYMIGAIAEAKANAKPEPKPKPAAKPKASKKPAADAPADSDDTPAAD